MNPLVRVCGLLNSFGAKYLVIGAQACILHNYVRNTEDVDLLIPEDLENHERIIGALAELADHAAAELTPQDFVDNVVVKIADEIEVDVSTRAWKVSYDDAVPSSLHVMIEGIKIPYVDLPILIASKRTYRAQDQIDVEHLNALLFRRDSKKRAAD